MRLTIDTETDTHKQAIAAAQAANGLQPATPPHWPEPRIPGPARRTCPTPTSPTAGANRPCSS